MKGNEGYWGRGISIITQNFSKSPSIQLIPLFPKSPVVAEGKGTHPQRGSGGRREGSSERTKARI
jgi:hypothetical protein